MFVTFDLWRNELPDYTGKFTPVTVNPHEVTYVEDYCGTVRPGSKITLKDKKVFLVIGVHADIVAKLEAARKE
jgi:hypothetical protein